MMTAMDRWQDQGVVGRREYEEGRAAGVEWGRGTATRRELMLLDEHFGAWPVADGGFATGAELVVFALDERHSGDRAAARRFWSARGVESPGRSYVRGFVAGALAAGRGGRAAG